ncbi:MAG: hypothetical protein AAGK32_21245 [Actinomycetota bacterium]
MRPHFTLAVFGVFFLLGLLWMLRADRADRFLASPEAAKLATTLWSVLLAVVASATLFVAANMLFNQAGKSYTRFSALLGGLLGFITFGLLDGNRLIQHLNGRDALGSGLHDIVNANEWTLLVFSIAIGALLIGGLGWAIGVVRDDIERWRLGGVVVGVIGGLLWGLFFAERVPVDTTVAVLWTPLMWRPWVPPSGLRCLAWINRSASGWGPWAVPPSASSPVGWPSPRSCPASR